MVPDDASTGWSPPAHRSLMHESWYRRRFYGLPTRGRMHKQPWQTMPRRQERVGNAPLPLNFPTKKELARYCLKEWRYMTGRVTRISGTDGGEKGDAVRK
jgi:hypothetical protein